MVFTQVHIIPFEISPWIFKISSFVAKNHQVSSTLHEQDPYCFL